jgi:hypothetical protein
MTTPDAKLDAIAAGQFIWKTDAMKRIGVEIVERAMRKPTLWPDSLKLDWLAGDDVNCIGNCYRLLLRHGIIAQTGRHRRSQSTKRNSGVVFEYRIDSVAKANTFLTRNKRTVKPIETQPDLLIMPTPFPNN